MEIKGKGIPFQAQNEKKSNEVLLESLEYSLCLRHLCNQTLQNTNNPKGTL